MFGMIFNASDDRRNNLLSYSNPQYGIGLSCYYMELYFYVQQHNKHGIIHQNSAFFSHSFHSISKGQLISEGLFGVLNFPKNQQKI